MVVHIRAYLNRVPEEGSIGTRLEGRGFAANRRCNQMSLPFFAYLLRCSDGSFYAGHTDNMEKRLWQHQMGEGSKYTHSRLPVELVWFQEFTTRDEAKAAEFRLKGWSRAKKIALIEGRFDIISLLASRSAKARALRDAPSLREGAPQEHGLSIAHKVE